MKVVAIGVVCVAATLRNIDDGADTLVSKDEDQVSSKWYNYFHNDFESAPPAVAEKHEHHSLSDTLKDWDIDLKEAKTSSSMTATPSSGGEGQVVSVPLDSQLQTGESAVSKMATVFRKRS
mmetsp:Transcript_9117/g.21850  ORF Transcript_9117/g.21850 Transcript_9117/m.21850 type:complete len:121 (-) Transcript_9117:84-446(-)